MKKYILPALALSMLIAIPVLGASSTDFDFNPFGETKDIGTLLSKIIDFLILLAIPISAILIVYAGYLYITSAGNEDKVKTAQKALIWALVGFGVVLIASGVPAIIQEFLYGKEEPAGIEGEAGAGVGTGAVGEIEFGTEGTVVEEEVTEETEEYSEEDFEYKVCRISVESGEPFCSARIWYGTDPKPANECEFDSDCQPFSAPTSGTYKICRKSNWSWLSGNQTLYCKTAAWTGEKPEDECSVLNEVCPVGTGPF